jgi:hypothetical protein
MKRTVQVTITKEIEVDIPDDKLTPEALEEFSSYMWEVTEPHELFTYAAEQFAQYGTCFVEGLGQGVPSHLVKFSEIPDPINFSKDHEDIESEIVE